MKNFYLFKCLVFFAIIILSNNIALHAQGIYQLWGTTVCGGEDHRGVLFSTKYDGSGYDLKKSFSVSYPGEADAFTKPVLYNGIFYCAMRGGGLNDAGMIATYNPVNAVWNRVADFNTIGGYRPEDFLIVYNGKLYGVSGGGVNTEGLLFEFNPANNTLTKLYDFEALTGAYPKGALTLYNNKFYGVTSSDGINGDGVVYEFNPANNTYTKKADFVDAVTGTVNYGTTMIVYNNLLWGATNTGASNQNGALFSFNPANNALLKKVDFQTIGSGFCHGSLALLNNKLYGNTGNSGLNGFGAIFEYNPANNALINKYDLSFVSAKYQMNFTVYNNKLYGCSTAGGAYNTGQLFSFNPANNQYSVLLDLQESTGSRGTGALTFYNNKLWGFTSEGAGYNEGSLFSYDLSNASFTTMINLGGTELQFPVGPMMYYNNKIYGTCERGGTLQNSNNKGGGIFEYNPATGVFTMKLSMIDSNARYFDNGGFVLLNNKFYGVSSYGGNEGKGSLYVYDPALNQLIKKHDFTDATGSYPFGALSVYNGKLYGTCSNGSANGIGNLYQFDPATDTYAQKVVLDQAKGSKPYCRLTWFNNRFYGVCFNGGTHFKGTLFEYNPAINSYLKIIDFDSVNGGHPYAGLTELNGKLYGTTMYGGSLDSGTLFVFDPVAATLTKKVNFSYSSGELPLSKLTVQNNKLYGMTSAGGNSKAGTLYEYNPGPNSLLVKKHFTPSTGSRARSNELLAVPALAAPGSPNSCINLQTVSIDVNNYNQWIPFTDAQGRAVAEINANGNILGSTTVRLYVNGGNVRQDGNGDFYLDRNITISPTNQPATPVSIRLYIKQTEFADLAATVGAGVVVPADLSVFRNTDFCASDLTAAKTLLASTYASWASDYVYSTEADSLGSFYFAGNANVALPVVLLSFSGQAEPTVNRLQWKANCTHASNFILTRSADAIDFKTLTVVNAKESDCDLPFEYIDASPLSGQGYYRLEMKDEQGQVRYSNILMISRGSSQAGLQLAPNPVSGSQLTVYANAAQNGISFVSIADMSGRILHKTQYNVSKGANSINLPTGNLSNGTYLLLYDDGAEKQAIRFVVQK